MRRVRARARLLWLGLACTLFALACGHAAAPSAQTAETPRPAPQKSATPGLFLYEVQKGAQPSYLLGTIHLGFGFDEVLTPAGRRGFDGSQRVWLEADVASANPMQLVSAAVLPADQSLRKLLGEPTWVELVAALKTQIPEPVLDRLKPWMPAMIVGLTRMGEALAELRPGAGDQRMDVEVITEATKGGKQLFYLETVQEQIAVFESIPFDEQVRELRHTLSPDSAGEGRALLEAFASGDEAALESALFMQGGSMQQAPGFYGELLDRRNERWLPKLTPELDQGGAFIAVGAAHLLGEHGLLRSLRDRGYSVTRVGE